MLSIDDAHMPGLADLSHERLCTITGADEVDILRLRYRLGKRAILHVATRTDAGRNEGALWFFGGEKGRRVARRNKTVSHFDAESQALFEAFPQDHRAPQIRSFLDQYESILPAMTGFHASAEPVLLRYRPGLSCTFRCALKGQAPAFVKLVNDDDPVRVREANAGMQDALASSDISVAPVLGIDTALGAIAYGGARGLPLDHVLSKAGDLEPLKRAIAGLRHFWTVPVVPVRTMGPQMLLTRARESAEFVAVTAPSCLADTSAIVARLEETVPDAPLCPIHGDMKLEHVFLDQGRTTLIDTESVSLGFADYDLAQLYGRLWQAEFEGQLPRALVSAASDQVRAEAGPAFEWCLGIVAVRLAKFYAQRPSPETAESIRAILGRLG